MKNQHDTIWNGVCCNPLQNELFFNLITVNHKYQISLPSPGMFPNKFNAIVTTCDRLNGCWTNVVTKIRVNEALSVNEGHGSKYDLTVTFLTCY